MVTFGIDRLEEYSHLFRGKRLGMVTSASALAGDGRPAYIAFHERYPLTCLFSPEHGLHARFGNGEEVCEDPIDPQTGAAVVSLFGNWTAKSIPAHWLEQLDAVVYDIQDLGTRFYTFITTMIRVLEDCAAAGRELIILDRPAVLGGKITEGCLLNPRYKSFIGAYSLPIRYGLTVGELAAMVNGEQKLGCRLHIVPCKGWKREQMFPEYGDLWVKPSGAIGDFETALLYPGMCLFESTNLSEGRGTGKPFRLVGAPFIDGQRLCREMEALNLAGVEFEAVQFCPESSKFRGELCGGVSLRVTNPKIFRTVHTGAALLYQILEMYPGRVEFRPAPWSEEPHIRFLSGCDQLDGVRPPLEQLLKEWEQDCEAFQMRKSKYHIYL
jgi:uncharacterized protein YbbC (DUF1343 family)